MPDVTNVCAGPFGAFYDFYIERPWLSRIIGRVVWGVELAPLYASMRAIGELPDGATVLDVPCGGGVALRALRPDQRVRWVGVDIDDAMLARFERRASERAPQADVEPLRADMRELPLPDATVDLALAYSGLHMVADPAAAVAEIVRCLRPGGELIGSTFLAEGSRRQRRLLGQGQDSGINGTCPPADDLRRWLADAGVEDASVTPERGFAVFRGRRLA